MFKKEAETKNFAIIGCGGYVAPRHLKAIKETGNNLVAALDKNDTIGILDKYFYDVDFFTDFERFDRHLEKLRMMDNNNKKVDFVTICSPNYLHDAHIRFALRIGANAICEKPIVINPWNLKPLEELEKTSGKKVYTVLQLRHHPSLIKLKEEIEREKSDKKHDIELTYITPRGKWYDYSWKGELSKSGGVSVNIGIHFFDMLIWMFGEVKDYELHHSTKRSMAGFLELEKARVKWFLSLDEKDMNKVKIKDKKNQSFRSIKVDGREIEFSDVFSDLHTEVYKDILAGKGFGISEAKESIELTYKLRNAKIKEDGNFMHPLILKNGKKIFCP